MCTQAESRNTHDIRNAATDGYFPLHHVHVHVFHHSGACADSVYQALLPREPGYEATSLPSCYK